MDFFLETNLSIDSIDSLLLFCIEITKVNQSECRKELLTPNSMVNLRQNRKRKKIFKRLSNIQYAAESPKRCKQRCNVAAGLCCFFGPFLCKCQLWLCLCVSVFCCLGQRTAHAGADSQSLSSPNWSPRSSLACNNSNNDIHCKRRPSAITLPQQHRRDWRWARASCLFQLNLNLSTDIDFNCNQMNLKRYVMFIGYS